MTICDLCKKNVPTKVCAFGKVVLTDWRSLPNWDFCEECQKKVLNEINKFIGEAKL